MAESISTSVDSVEQWRPVAGYEGWYSVSSLGRVRREKTVTSGRAGAIIKCTPDAYGYLHASLSMCGKIKTAKVHTLVAKAFICPRPNRMEVNHIDGNKGNPRASNLEYVTRSENAIHALRTGLRNPLNHSGEKNSGSKLTVAEVSEIRRLAATETVTQTFLANAFKINQSCISRIIANKRWQALVAR